MIAWQPRQNLVGVLDINVTRLEKTTFAESFEGWDVKAEEKKKVTPYFVHATVTNLGETNLSQRLVPLYAVDTADTLVEPTKFTEEFKPCPGGALPRGYFTDDTAEVCMVYLIGDGLELGGVTFRPTEDFDAITWTGEIERIEKPKSGQSKKDKKAATATRAEPGGLGAARPRSRTMAACPLPTSLTLGSLRVETPVVLAPMAGITNAAYRRLCLEQARAQGVTDCSSAR